ncbi:MAG: thymidylate synthase [Sulfitobacter sp.]|uniref:thymidylate synthase n=1 Tax=Sulfitobacter sp. TaxID=1903071 RepID=UPI003002F4A9
MRAVYLDLLEGQGTTRVSSKKGDSTERFGALLELSDPLARVSRSVRRARIFSALGELFWYLSGSNKVDHIEHYIKGYREFSDDGLTANGAYGPRIFGSNGDVSEWDRVMDLLGRKERQGSRNAVIQVLCNEDLTKETKDRPCTTTLQFVVRERRLNLHIHMRSNDAYLGLPHDIFSFTMFLEIAARQLDLEVGSYFHSVGSLHLYDDKDEAGDPKPTTNARSYLGEQFMSIRPMPSMPEGDPWPWINKIVALEKNYRAGGLDKTLDETAPAYWRDIDILLRCYSAMKSMEGEDRIAFLDNALDHLSETGYRLFILDRLAQFEQE